MNKAYICLGYKFKSNNGHLSKTVGDIRTLEEWIEIAYPGKNARAFFEGDKDRYVIDYLKNNMGIRLKEI